MGAEFGSLTLLLFILIASAHLLGYLFSRLRQPRVVGEIAAGVLLGPALLGHFAPQLSAAIFHAGDARHPHDAVLGFLYNLGLLLLMFASGAETRALFGRDDRRQVAWIALLGTGLPFGLVLLAGPWLPLAPMMGAAAHRTALLLVVGIAVAVTSIPVISRIFYDLKILHTRFARLVLGVAVLEDIALWGVLAIATALAQSGSLPRAAIARHLLINAGYFAAGLWLAPPLLRRLSAARWNVLAQSSPVGYAAAVLFAYAALADAVGVSLVFAAFLAGYAMASSGERAATLEPLRGMAFAVFIPVYFVIVGWRLDLGRNFSVALLLGFLVIACAVKLATVWLGARGAGFRGLDAINLAVATNARGGPGIVLASVAFDAHIINASFYTTLVLIAVLTSQAAGAWLEYVLRRGWPLLAPVALEAVPAGDAATPEQLAA
jgi:Kef-type K+ transport system membrane component KefB